MKVIIASFIIDISNDFVKIFIRIFKIFDFFVAFNYLIKEFNLKNSHIFWLNFHMLILFSLSPFILKW